MDVNGWFVVGAGELAYSCDHGEDDGEGVGRVGSGMNETWATGVVLTMEWTVSTS